MAQNQLQFYLSSVIASYAKANIQRSGRLIVENAKAAAIVEFDNHPITQALENHDSGGVVGTLFGFIGFEAGEEPTKIIREMLYDEIEFSGITQLTNRKFIISYEFPSKEDIYDVTDLPWADGRSWCEMLDTTGIPGLAAYVPKRGKGRSEEGVQNKRVVGGSKYPKVPYISRIINNFKKRVSEGVKNDINFQ